MNFNGCLLRNFIDFIEEKDIKSELSFTKKCFAKLKYDNCVKWLRYDVRSSYIDIEALEKEYHEFLNKLFEKYDYVPDEIFDFTPYKNKKSLFQKLIDFFSFE